MGSGKTKTVGYDAYSLSVGGLYVWVPGPYKTLNGSLGKLYINLPFEWMFYNSVRNVSV